MMSCWRENTGWEWVEWTCLQAIIGRNIAHVNLLAMLSFMKLCKLYTRVVVFMHCNFRHLFIALLQIINNFCHFPFEMKEPKADRAGESPSLGWADHYVCTTSKWIKKKLSVPYFESPNNRKRTLALPVLCWLVQQSMAIIVLDSNSNGIDR